MTNSEIKLMHRMYGFLKVNKTHQILVSKATPGSKLPSLQKQAGKDHKEVVDRLMLDRTKNDGGKLLFAAQHAENKILALLRQVDSERDNATALKDHLEQKIEAVLNPEEPNPVDALTRITMLQNIRGMKLMEVLDLIKAGDQEAAKCLRLPLARKQFGLDDAERARTVQEASEKTLLNKTEYENLQIARQATDAYIAMGDGLGDLAGTCIRVQREIQETVVEAA